MALWTLLSSGHIILSSGTSKSRNLVNSIPRSGWISLKSLWILIALETRRTCYLLGQSPQSYNRVFSVLCEKISSGWLAWKDVSSYLLPPASTSPLLPWCGDCEEAVTAIREIVTQPSYWQKLTKHYSSENHSEVIVQDNASCVKSICEQLNV